MIQILLGKVIVFLTGVLKNSASPGMYCDGDDASSEIKLKVLSLITHLQYTYVQHKLIMK